MERDGRGEHDWGEQRETGGRGTGLSEERDEDVRRGGASSQRTTVANGLEREESRDQRTTVGSEKEVVGCK